MRADRLVAVLLTLQARGRVTASELASELEISVATARRDLEALSAAGIPVYPQAGRGGGWQLLGGARTDLSGLNSAEARALFLLVGPVASVDPEAKSALRKLLRALPAPFRDDAAAAAEAVVTDRTAWGAGPAERPAVVDLLQRAIVDRVRVRIEYGGWGRDPVERVIDPLAVVEKNSAWYLLALSDGSDRTYRVDRIRNAEPTIESSARPDDFDATAAWERVVDTVERQRASAQAVLIADAAIVTFLRSALGSSAVTIEPLDDHRSRVTVGAATEVLLARQLAGWGEYLEVVEPQSLRVELARLGARLIERNG